MSTAVEIIDEAIAMVDALLAKASMTSANGAVSANQQLKPEAVTLAPALTDNKPAKEPKPAKEAKPAKVAKAPTAEGPTDAGQSEDAALFAKALLKVAKVASVDDLENSEKLYKLTVDVGNGEIKQVCAGLKQYISKAALQGSLVTVVLNLKPAKLAGQLSEAMIMAADATAADGTTLVRTLVPPAGSEPGDMVYLEEGAPTQAPAKQMKSDDWKKIVAGLSVQASKAAFSGTALVTSRGTITLPAEIPEGSGIH